MVLGSDLFQGTILDGTIIGGMILTRPLVSLTVDEVYRLLAFLELGTAAEMFRKADFNGEALAGASGQDLRDVGMKIGANRTHLLNRIKEFVAHGVPAEAIGRCPKP